MARDGKEIKVERAPTHFGPMSFRIKGTAQGVRLTLDPPKRNPPRKVALHLPTSCPLINPTEQVEVVTRKDQTARIYFWSTLDKYRDW